MKEEDIKRMWDIDSKLQLGDEVSEEDKLFFNNNYISMIEAMDENRNHWFYHTSKI